MYSCCKECTNSHFLDIVRTHHVNPNNLIRFALVVAISPNEKELFLLTFWNTGGIEMFATNKKKKGAIPTQDY